jgi:hypothetical protein
MEKIISGSPIKESYFVWLWDLVRGPGPKKLDFARSLHSKEFTGIVPNDRNRASDGRKLREQFCEDREIPLVCDPDWYNEPCSVLEMLVGLAQNIEFILYEPRRGNRTSKWFWEMIKNLGLEVFPDHYRFASQKIYDNEKLINQFIGRYYSEDGTGGLFPLRRPKDDQRRIEIWYQLMAYLGENYRV